MIKTTSKLKAAIFGAAALLACAGMLVACDNNDTKQPTDKHVCENVCDTCSKCTTDCTDPVCSVKCEGHETTATEYKVTFRYGFDEANFDEATGYASVYTQEYVATVKPGRKFSVSATLKRTFDCMNGYAVVGYSDESWNTAVDKDMDVKVKYEKLATVSVTFEDALGDVIKTETSYVSGSLNPSQMPDTTNPVYLLDAEQFGRLSTAEKAKYEAYANDDSMYIATADKARLGSSLVLPLGKVFTGWNGTLGGFTENVTVTPVTKDSTAVIGYSDAPLTVDGEKDDAYVSMGKIWRKRAESTNYDEKYSDSEWASRNFECELFMAWDGDYMYFYIDVTDNHVISFGKDYNEQLDNPFVQDNIEIWYSLGGNRHKLIVDAFGYELHSVAAQTSGVSAYFEDHVKNNYVTKLKGADLADFKNNNAVEATGATGYVIEFAMPCYYEPTTNGQLSDEVGGENWGQAMTRGHYFYVGLQADNVGAVMSASGIQTCINAKSSNSADPSFLSSSFEPFGYQITSDKRVENAWLLVLG